MAIVEFHISKSKFKIECPEDEKKKVLDLAKKVDKRIKKLSQHFSNIEDKTLMAVACLTMEDEIETQRSKSGRQEIEKDLSQDLDNLLDKIDLVAKKIEKY